VTVAPRTISLKDCSEARDSANTRASASFQFQRNRIGRRWRDGSANGWIAFTPNGLSMSSTHHCSAGKAVAHASGADGGIAFTPNGLSMSSTHHCSAGKAVGHASGADRGIAFTPNGLSMSSTHHCSAGKTATRRSGEGTPRHQDKQPVTDRDGGVAGESGGMRSCKHAPWFIQAYAKRVGTSDGISGEWLFVNPGR
jgi:hypothetical protein